MKFRPKKLSLALARTFSTGVAVTFVSVAYAQTPPAVQLAPTQVTGSRIVSPNITSTSPVAQVTATDIKLEGVNNVENLLNNLPQVFADFGGNLSNGATGTATVNLRNLGSARTLVLINGRRLPAGSPTFYPTDLNQIPAPLIERVELLTGGASAIYGSDAVAGVVNFIMKDNFQGLQLQLDLSGYNHQQHNGLADVINARAATNPSQFQVPGDKTYDGQIYDASITMGSNFADNKGNATLFFHYMHTDSLLQKDRDYSACSTGSNADGLTCAGSSTSFPGRFLDNKSGKSFTIADAAGNVRPFNATLDQFNFAPYNYYQRPDERYGFNAFAHFDINEHVRTYGEFSFNDDHTVAQIAPSGLFFGGQEFFLKDANPFLSTAFKNTFGITPTSDGDLLIGRRNVEGGGRQDDRRHTAFRGVLGVKGDIWKNWDYDIFVQTGKVIYQETYLNDFSKTRITRAVDVVKDPTTGNPVCASKLDGSDPNCVPYNIFALDKVTPEALAYLQTPGLQKGSTQQAVQGATLTASDLSDYGWRLPWAKSGVGVSFGVERRVEKLDLETDTAFSTFDLAGQGGPTIGLAGQFTVKEVFVEARVPIIEGKEWADLLSVNGSYRYSDYSTDKTTDSYGIGAEWAPIKAVRLRGSYQQAVRAANVIELFQAQGLNLFNQGSDPCAGPTPAATLAQCARSGVTAAQYGSALLTNPAGQYNYLQGGNPALDPEKAKSTTFGVVWTPMKNLSASVDYFKIKVDNQINNIAPALIVTQCVFSGQFCDLIHRDSFGTLWLTGFVTATNQNISNQKTSGIDVTFNYSYPLQNYGSLDFNFIGTWLEEFKTTPVPGLGEYDCKGLFGATCGTPLPEWRHKARVTWMTPWNTDLSLSWRHFDKVKIDSSSGNPLLSGAFNPVNGEMGQRDYFDLAASWNATKQLTIWGGINNLFDRDPPIVDSAIAGPAFGSGNTYPQVYDSLGRKLFLSLQYKF
jgi:outer membrane receptor protein involved in Fe transport